MEDVTKNLIAVSVLLLRGGIDMNRRELKFINILYTGITLLGFLALLILGMTLRA